MSLKQSYTLMAPFYDGFVTAATRSARKRSLAVLSDIASGKVLILGVGTGLDLPYLPLRHQYVGVDLTAAMLKHARPRTVGLQCVLLRGDAQRLPFPAASFDAIVLHLILTVVPEPTLCIAEVARVLRPGGQVLIFDKFLRPGETGWKRWINPLTRRVATRLDVVFEEVMESAPSLQVTTNEAVLAGGWFRLIRLQKSIV
jgi:ubiquinone/menaquinone biosynthesis C-methylase UbiE